MPRKTSKFESHRRRREPKLKIFWKMHTNLERLRTNFELNSPNSKRISNERNTETHETFFTEILPSLSGLCQYLQEIYIKPPNFTRIMKKAIYIYICHVKQRLYHFSQNSPSKTKIRK